MTTQSATVTNHGPQTLRVSSPPSNTITWLADDTPTLVTWNVDDVLRLTPAADDAVGGPGPWKPRDV